MCILVNLNLESKLFFINKINGSSDTVARLDITTSVTTSYGLKELLENEE